MDLWAESRGAILAVACEVIRRRLGAVPAPDPVLPADPALTTPAGCFVTLHNARSRALRGCIGRLEATAPLLEVLSATAVSVLSDSRFARNPVTLAELPQLTVEVSVLSPLQPASNPMDFDPMKQGILLTLGQHTGCFLPQVARETGWNRQQLLERLCAEKMGLPANAWQNPAAKLQTFTAEVIGPQSF